MGIFGSVLSGLGGLVGSIAGASSNAKAVRKANAANQAGLQNALDENARQFDVTRQDFQPYQQAGVGALDQINQLLGISTPGTAGSPDYKAYLAANPDIQVDWQRGKTGMSLDDYAKYHYENFGQREGRAIPMSGATSPTGGGNADGVMALIKDSPIFQSMYRTGEEAVLQNAAATGGLRGGNAQRSLADFGSDTAAQALQYQLSQLFNSARIGSGAAANGGSIGAGLSSNAQDLMTQQGQGNAGAILGKQAVYNNLSNEISKAIGSFIPKGGF